MGNTPSVNMSSENTNEVGSSHAGNHQAQDNESHNLEVDTAVNNVEGHSSVDSSTDPDPRSSSGRTQPPFLRLSLFPARRAAAHRDNQLSEQQQLEVNRTNEQLDERPPRRPAQGPLRTLEMVSIHRRQVSHLLGTIARQRILSAARSAQRQPQASPLRAPPLAQGNTIASIPSRPCRLVHFVSFKHLI